MKRESLAVHAGGHQREHDRRRSDERHDGDPFAMRRARRASAPGSAIPGQPGVGQQPQIDAVARRREQLGAARGDRRRRRARRCRSPESASRARATAGRRARAWRSRRRSGRGRGPRRSYGPAARARARSRRGDSARRKRRPRRHRVARLALSARPARATPAARSIVVRRISGRPISAVGSSLSMLSKSEMPSASERTLPVQS